MIFIFEGEKTMYRDELYASAKTKHIKNISAFLAMLANKCLLPVAGGERQETIIHNLTAAALAGMSIIADELNSSTSEAQWSFCKSAAMWELIIELGNKQKSSGLRLLDFDDLLSEKAETKFKTIPGDVWKMLQKKAQKLLEDNPTICGAECNYLSKIVAGEVPFGWEVGEEKKNEVS